MKVKVCGLKMSNLSKYLHSAPVTWRSVGASGSLSKRIMMNRTQKLMKALNNRSTEGVLLIYLPNQRRQNTSALHSLSSPCVRRVQLNCLVWVVIKYWWKLRVFSLNKAKNKNKMMEPNLNPKPEFAGCSTFKPQEKN